MRVAVEEWELYNNGILLCKWFDTEEDTIEDIEEFVKEAKEANDLNGDDCEMFVADYEDDTGLYDGECLNWAYELTELLEDLESYDLKKVEYMTSQVGYGLQEAIDKVDDCDMYEDMTMEQLADNFVDEGLFGEIPEAIQNYLDYEAIARDLSYDYTEYNGDIFRCD